MTTTAKLSEALAERKAQANARIAELERIVGQKQLNIDYLEKVIELAKEELGIDIKKNSDTPQSGGSTSKNAQ